MQAASPLQSAPARPGLLYRLALGGFSLLLMYYGLRLLGLELSDLVDISLALPVLVSWGALLLFRFHELRGIELHLRRKPARTSLAASRQFRPSSSEIQTADILPSPPANKSRPSASSAGPWTL